MIVTFNHPKKVKLFYGEKPVVFRGYDKIEIFCDLAGDVKLENSNIVFYKKEEGEINE